MSLPRLDSEVRTISRLPTSSTAVAPTFSASIGAWAATTPSMTDFTAGSEARPGSLTPTVRAVLETTILSLPTTMSTMPRPVS